MSGFVRRLQRTLKRTYRKPGKGIGIHYNGRGSKLGVHHKCRCEPFAEQLARREARRAVA